MNIKFFSKVGCGLCNMVKMRIKNYSNIDYILLNDDSPEIEQYQISTVPTMIIGDNKYTTPKDIYDILEEKGVKNV